MFSRLTSTEFEDFCYRLLKLQGLENVDWRKGTNKNASPSDDGRDIECEYHRYDNILQRTVIEKWFVECKHYKEGVSPDKIQGALSWAQAERPHRLILVASGFFSNPCKDYIQKYKKENKPTFDIEIWEKPQIEKQSKKYPYLLKNFDIIPPNDIFKYFNNYHLAYIEEMPQTKFDIFENAINELSLEEKAKIFELMFFYYVEDSIEALDVGKSISYQEWIMKKIQEQEENLNILSVNAFIHIACNELLAHSLPYKIEKCINMHEKMKVRMYDKFKDNMSIGLKTIFENKDNYRLNKDIMLNLYNSFCNNVVKYIIEHPYFPKFEPQPIILDYSKK